MSIQQRSPEWLEARKGLVTGTDLPVLLGLSPFKSEAQLAREKLGEIEPQEQSLAMSIGLAVEPVIKDEYERVTGWKLRRVHSLVTHPRIAWAAVSPDFRVVGQKRLMEAKWTSRKLDDELPQDMEAQARWQAGVAGVPVVDVAALVRQELRIYTVEHDEATFDGLVAIAADFRRRLAEGGPFAENAASIKARYPFDDGTEIQADEEIEEAVERLLALRDKRAEFEAAADTIETAVKARMGEATRLVGRSWAITWKRTKDIVQTDWRMVADGLLRRLPETERIALVGAQTQTRPGFRAFRLSVNEKGGAE